MHNNAFVRMGAGTTRLFDSSEVQWVNGATLAGSNNWVQDGIRGTPESWTNTLTGADPGLVNLAGLDVRLKDGSPLADKGAANPPSISGREFPNPLAAPTFVPPSRQLSSTPGPRPAAGALDIGAFEVGSGTAAPPPGSSSGGASSGTTPGSSNGGPNGGAGASGADGDGDGCGCGVVGRCALDAFGIGVVTGLGALVLGRRRGRRARSGD